MVRFLAFSDLELPHVVQMLMRTSFAILGSICQLYCGEDENNYKFLIQ